MLWLSTIGHSIYVTKSAQSMQLHLLAIIGSHTRLSAISERNGHLSYIQILDGAELWL